MKASVISTRNGYGFGYDWQLSISTKKSPNKMFLLGQDCKFCSRVLGMDMSYIFSLLRIKEGRIVTEIEARRFGRFIIKELGLTEKILNDLQPWELCCQ